MESNDQNTLPDGWMEYDGMRFSFLFTPEVMKRATNFKFRPDDVLILTWPKSGTTWTMDIVSHMLNKAGIKQDLDKKLFGRIPFLEFGKPDPDGNLCIDVLEKDKERRFIKTHLLPNQLVDAISDHQKCKIIYVMRHPKDAMASYFHHSVSYDYYNGKPIVWSDFFNQYMQGKWEYGDWCDFTLAWMPFAHQENVLALTYEEMQDDLNGVVSKIASFLEVNLKPAIIDEIVQLASFDSMKEKYKDDEVVTRLVRKGKTGDYKNLFTVAQNEEFDEYFHKKMDGSGFNTYSM